ncbi:hypothetical protein B0H13DRAFT_1869854 [Mycena leptocephala]|nr:hypothetical protein B0H13DRAFT_1869854 [Mycena leptocephala]
MELLEFSLRSHIWHKTVREKWVLLWWIFTVLQWSIDHEQMHFQGFHLACPNRWLQLDLEKETRAWTGEMIISSICGGLSPISSAFDPDKLVCWDEETFAGQNQSFDLVYRSTSDIAVHTA